MKKIPLTQGKFVFIDDENFERLNSFKWYAMRSEKTFYAVRCSKRINGKRKTILMHRVIMNPPNNMDIDHIDHNGLNNQKVNLRVVTHSQNSMNRQKQKNISSIFKGVSYSKQNKFWIAEIRYNQKHIHLGCFEDEIDACIIYNQKAVELFGEYAFLNPIPEEYKDRTPVRRKKAKAEFSSTYRGVTWDKSSKKWRVRITKNKKKYYFGCFSDEQAAHQVYLKAKEEVDFGH